MSIFIPEYLLPLYEKYFFCQSLYEAENPASIECGVDDQVKCTRL